MQTFFQKFKLALSDATLRRRILFVLGALVIFRILAVVPIPGIDPVRLSEFLSNNQFFGLLNIFSGGGLSNLSIVMLGVTPYITASIIMQLLTVMSAKLKALYHEEGEAGRKRFMQYSRLIMVPLAVIQGVGLILILSRQGVVESLGGFDLLTNVIVITAGSVLLMWLGELISEFGIGNGVSLIIFAGIVAALPATVQQLIFTFDVAQIPVYLGFLTAAIIIVAGIIWITEAERPIPVSYAKRVRGGRMYGGIQTYLPLRLNQAGGIPIIFALSILLFPQMIVNFLVGVDNTAVLAVGRMLQAFFNNTVLYAAFYFFLVFFFTYFYTAVTFDPHSIATNLQKNGAFIPGVRPGNTTADYIAAILTRITLVGALFLGTVAVLPVVMQGITGITAFAIGGTSVLIVVAVLLDLVKKIDAQIAMREY
ncbi:MAG: preprotein translocase subunit SecY [Parcubacteria group bacterium]|nr:preprotein translocase subunit SecY [Parcubacteria group bacterium]